MSPAVPAMEYRRYRAPGCHGDRLADPPLIHAPRLAHENAGRLRSSGAVAGGRPLPLLLRQARADLFERVARYAASYGHSSWPQPLDPERTLILASGHQPQLFHPGVWYKNFELSRLARSINGVALHLIIDNDASGLAAIRVPTGSTDEPRIETAAYGVLREDVPFEDRGVDDQRLFESFGRRVERLIRPFVAQPLVREFWPSAVEAARRTGRLGLAIAQARHLVETQWGLDTCELPLSEACESLSFRLFLAGILDELSRFIDAYNESLDEFRRVHRIRSRAHPVPPLERDGEWLEVPCWIWTRDDPRRRRLYLRRQSGVLELTDRASLRHGITAPDGGELASTAEDLARLSDGGVRVRPRALMTTMYARLLVSDLFLHGIGGGKYDQLTDAIIERFFGITPPSFLVLSATLELPIPRPDAREEDRRRIDRTLRDLDFNPDRYAAVTEETESWIASKRRWLATSLPRGSRAARHAGIRQANEALWPAIAELREQLIAQRDALRTQQLHARLLGSREFAFCLFPAATLQALLLDKP
jgi:hypothetical protein